MRYKPKLPLYGSTMTEKKKREFGDANYKINQLLDGGPIEKAIRQDLISLRALFREAIEKDRQKEEDSFDSLVQNNHLYFSNQRRQFVEQSIVPNHKANGYSFQIFKQVYKKAKFGIIFTRAAPKNTRIDREAFVQLIFSSALSLLKDAIQSMEKDADVAITSNNSEESDSDDQSETTTNTNTNTTTRRHTKTTATRQGEGKKESKRNKTKSDRSIAYFNAVFAIYALYTLYKTNPAPHVPIDYDSDDDTDNQKYESISRKINDSTTESKEKYALTMREAKLLSTLPIGLTDTVDDSEARFYRRSYHSPIRISYQSLQLLEKVKKLSLVHMDDCRIAQYSILGKKYCKKKAFEEFVCSSSSDEDDQNDKRGKQSSDHTSSRDRLRCTCSLANDCITLIDRLVSDQCFTYCEYEGPVSVESYCGTDTYVRSTILGEEKSNDRVVSIDDNREKTILEDSLEDIDTSISELVNLDQLQSSLNDYQKLIGQMSLMIQMKSNDKTKQRHTVRNQLALIQTSIKPILKERQRRQKVSFAKQIDTILTSDGINQNHNIDTNNDKDETTQVFESSISQTDDTNKTNDRNQRDSKSIRFMFPETFSKSLKEGLERTLDDIILLDKEDKKDVTQQGEKIQSRRIANMDYLEDDFLGVGSFYGLEDLHHLENEDDDDFDMKSIATVETEHAGGAGNAALQLLLSKAMEVSARSIQKKTLRNRKRNSTKSSQESHTRGKGNPSKRKKVQNDLRSLDDDGDDDDDDVDGLSFATSVFGEQGSIQVAESGKIALQQLLNKASQNGNKKSKTPIAKGGKKGGKPEKSKLPKLSNPSSDEENSQSKIIEMTHEENDEMSLCSKSSALTNMSGKIGTGTIALQQLLQKASKASKASTASSSTKKQSTKPRAKGKQKQNTQINHDGNDDISLFSKSSIATDITGNVGKGTIALQYLLEKASKGPSTSSTGETKKNNPRKRVEARKTLEPTHDESDSATFSSKASFVTNITDNAETGTIALQRLLQKASKTSTSPKMKKRKEHQSISSRGEVNEESDDTFDSDKSSAGNESIDDQRDLCQSSIAPSELSSVKQF